MKTEKWIPSLIGGLLGFFAGWSACGCLITAFDLEIARPEGLWLAIGAASLLCALAFPLRRGRAAVAALGGVWLFLLWEQGDAWNQLLQLIFRLSYVYSKAYHWPVLELTGEPWNAGIADLPMQVLGCFLAALCCHTVGQGKRTWPAAVTAALPLVLCLVVTNTVPDEKWLFSLLLSLSLLVLTAAVRRSSAFHAARLMLYVLLPVAAFLCCLFLGIPRENYVNKSEELRENILTWVESVPARAEETAQQITTAVSGSSGEQVNLKTLGPRTSRRYPVLEVTSDRGGTVYLREGDYDSYTGTGWTATAHRSEPFDCDAAVDGGRVHIRTRVRRERLLLPYYPAADTLLVGGHLNNEENLREYTLEQWVLPENWRELVEERYRGVWESSIEFTAARQQSDHLDSYRYLNLPLETKARAEELLSSLLPGEGSATEKAEIIASFVRNCGEYDLNTGRMPSDAADFALWFLEESETGYCVHFATAAVVLLRAAKIPARYVSGYAVSCLPGETVTVTGDMAHAWAEYFEPLLGCWIPLEATPAEALQQPAETENTPSSEAPSQPTQPAPTWKPPSTEIPAETEPGPPQSPPRFDWKKLLRVLWILIPAALPELQRRIRLRLRKYSRTRGNRNEQALKLWQHIRLLAHLRREQPPRRMFDLAQKAKFSQHTLTREELAEMETHIEETVAYLQTCPWYQRLLHRYLFAAY